METEKSRYNYYLSYWESMKALPTDREKVEFTEIINKVQFFEEHIDRIKPRSKNVQLLFASIKHSLKSSIKGYCDKKVIDYDGLFTPPYEPPYQPPYQPPYEGAYQPPCHERVKSKEKGTMSKEKKKTYGEFNNILLTIEEHTKLEVIYKTRINTAMDKLSSYIESSGKVYKSHYAVLGKTQWVYKDVMANSGGELDKDTNDLLQMALEANNGTN